MLSYSEIQKIIYRDPVRKIEQEDWIVPFYELWKESFFAKNNVKSPSLIIQPAKEVLLYLIDSKDFDELHLFKIYENANVFALLKDLGGGNWKYKFCIIYNNSRGKIDGMYNDVEAIKARFNYVEPVLEIPLPIERKYVD